MIAASTPDDPDTGSALQVWAVFFVCAILVNGTLPFTLGADLRAWTESSAKGVLFHGLIYAGLFLATPLLLAKGWRTVSQPSFWLPVLAAAVALALRPIVGRAMASLVIPLLAYLHWRFDLSSLGFRSRSWKGDLAAAALLSLLNAVPAFLRPDLPSGAFGLAALAGLDRLLANPASTVENLFYFGFLAERLAPRAGRWLTPVIVGALYTAHEMTNPEYWYAGMSFFLVFAGVTLMAALYLWRRNVVVIWLGDGLGRLVGQLV